MSAFNAPGMSTRKIGRTIFSQALGALMKNKSVLVIPIAVFFVNVVVIALAVIAAVAVFATTGVGSNSDTLKYVIGAVIYIVLTVVNVFAQAIMMYAANDIFDGRKANLNAAVSAVAANFKNLLLFGLLESTVGLILRALAERLGNIGGGIVRLIGGLAWAVASYFSIPAILFAKAGPVESIKQSSGLIKAKWGNVWRANVVSSLALVVAMFLGFGLITTSIFMMVASVGASSVWVWLAGAGSVMIAGIALIMFSFLIQSAVVAFIKVALYRFVNNQPTGEIDSNLLEAGFKFRK
jgi:hypothetical protein